MKGLGTGEHVGVGLADAWSVGLGADGDGDNLQGRLDTLDAKIKPRAHRRHVWQRHGPLESGKHDPPLSRVEKLAKALGVPVTALLE